MSTRELLNVISSIGDKGATFKSLAEPWADTSSATGSLMLQILACIAEFERKLIKTRCDEGRVRAKERGVRFGRKPKLTPHQVQEAMRRREAGEPMTEIGRLFNVSHSTISRL
jgi:DNA invertase Pin-like site-specific DNA recombinase